MNDWDKPLSGESLIKEVNRRIRLARSYWDAHNNAACRTHRERAIALYETLGKEQKEKIPQALRVWLRYRSEKYFGEQRTAPKGKSAGKPRGGAKEKGKGEPQANTRQANTRQANTRQPSAHPASTPQASEDPDASPR